MLANVGFAADACSLRIEDEVLQPYGNAVRPGGERVEVVCDDLRVHAHDLGVLDEVRVQIGSEAGINLEYLRVRERSHHLGSGGVPGRDMGVEVRRHGRDDDGYRCATLCH